MNICIKSKQIYKLFLHLKLCSKITFINNKLLSNGLKIGWDRSHIHKEYVFWEYVLMANFKYKLVS